MAVEALRESWRSVAREPANNALRSRDGRRPIGAKGMAVASASELLAGMPGISHEVATQSFPFTFPFKALKPDYANASAVMVSVDGRFPAVWETVKDVCPLPLLNHWQKPILGFLRANQQIREIEGFGIAATLIDLDVGAIEGFIEESSLSGIMTA